MFQRGLEKRKSFQFLQFITELTSPLVLNICVFPHLVEHLELHHQFVAGGRPHSHTAVLAAGGKVSLVRAEHHVIHLDSREKFAQRMKPPMDERSEVSRTKKKFKVIP